MKGGRSCDPEAEHLLGMQKVQGSKPDISS